ncbi:MAG: sterol carrier family protein [Actinomycetes bacterium]
MTRRSPPATVLAAYDEQWTSIRGWVGALDRQSWERPSAVSGWTVRDLVAHFVLVADSLAAAASAPTHRAPMSVSDYLASYAEGAAGIDGRTREWATGDVVAALDERAHAAAEAVSELLAAGDSPTVVEARRGPIRLDDFVLTRLVELTVHGDDLARSVPPGPPLTRRALQLAVRCLADVVAARSPGRSVELRIPPFAAVQCMPGPSHTRGTPPAVVETDPVTWLRLASGRLSWSEAVATGSVQASGERAELASLMPLLG